MKTLLLAGLVMISGGLVWFSSGQSAPVEQNALGATVLFPSGGGTGSSTLTGILRGDGTSAVKSVYIGNNLTFDGTTLSASGGSSFPTSTVPLMATNFVATSTEIASQLPYASSTALTATTLFGNRASTTYASTTVLTTRQLFLPDLSNNGVLYLSNGVVTNQSTFTTDTNTLTFSKAVTDDEYIEITGTQTLTASNPAIDASSRQIIDFATGHSAFNYAMTFAPNQTTGNLTSFNNNVVVDDNSGVSGSVPLVVSNSLALTLTTGYGGTVTTWRPLSVSSPTVTNGQLTNLTALLVGATGIATNTAGVLIGDLTSTGNNASIVTGGTGIPVGDFDLYINGDYPSVFLSTTTSALYGQKIILTSDEVAIVADDFLAGIAFNSNDSNLTAPGLKTAAIDAIANSTHTASALDTSLAFSTTDGTTYAERMRITDAGEVGIGTPTPNTELEILTTSSASIANMLRLSNDGSGNGTGSRIGFTTSGQNTDHSFVQDAYLDAERGHSLQFGVGGLSTNAGTIAATLTGQFRFGIGTTTPLHLLTVSTSTPQIALTDGTSSSFAWTLRSISNSLYFATSTALATSTTAAFSINSNGGITVPAITSALGLYGATGVLGEYAGTICTNQFVRTLDAAGAATCATVGTADVSGLDISDDTNATSGNGVTVNGDTFDFDCSDVTDSDADDGVTCTIEDIVVSLGAAISSSEITDGQIVNADISSTAAIDFSKIHLTFSPAFTASAATVQSIQTPSLDYSTSTWTGTTTRRYITDIAFTLNGARCNPQGGTLNVHIGSGAASTTMFSASTTGFMSFSANNTFATGTIMYVEIGTPASSPVGVSCTFRKTV